MVLTLMRSEFTRDPFWRIPLTEQTCPGPECVNLFDQNGYDLSPLEIEYSKVNAGWHSQHRNNQHIALRLPWFEQEPRTQGAVLNHALIFERKGYADGARDQLEAWAQQNHLKIGRAHV